MFQADEGLFASRSLPGPPASDRVTEPAFANCRKSGLAAILP